MSNPGYVGDGCNMFVTAVIRLFKEGKVGSITGVTSESMRSGNQTFDNAMYNLGFKKYQLVGGSWKCMSKDNPMGEDVEMSLDELKQGDMLLRENASDGHIEFYLGRKYKQSYNNNNLFIGKYDITENDEIKNYSLTKEGGQVVPINGKEGTFSFGRTHDKFPIIMNGSTNLYFYFTFNEEDCSNKFRLRYSTYNYNEYDNIGDYDTIWRYE